MNMILSSCDFHEEHSKAAVLENLPRPIGDCRALFIPNENATPENLRTDMYFRRMRQKGFKKGNIFVFDHTRPADFFRLPLDVVYISGGNTFLTLQKLRSTGFDRELVRLVRSGVTYVGGSAGAHVVSKSVSHVARYDPLPENFDDFSGLGLFNGIFVCHFSAERDEHFRSLKAAGENVFSLRNDQTIIVTENGFVYR